jgi:DNA polymerase-3 subunit epsilon
MRFIAFDLETTGFLPGVDQITEIGAVRFVDGEPVEVFATLVNPKRPIPKGAQDVTGITDEMVANQPEIGSLLTPFAEFCGQDLVVAHNAPFDFQFLSSDIKKFESPAPKGIVLDTCAMARKVLPGLMNYKLGTLVQHLNIPSGGFHRAQEDATYCGYLFKHMLSKISNQGQIPEIETLIQLSGKSTLVFPQIIRQPKQLELL